MNIPRKRRLPFRPRQLDPQEAARRVAEAVRRARERGLI